MIRMHANGDAHTEVEVTTFNGFVMLAIGLALVGIGIWLTYEGAIGLRTGAALGNIAGPWLAGRVFDAHGSYAPVIAGCAALSLLATLATWRALRR